MVTVTYADITNPDPIIDANVDYLTDESNAQFTNVQILGSLATFEGTKLTSKQQYYYDRSRQRYFKRYGRYPPVFKGEIGAVAGFRFYTSRTRLTVNVPDSPSNRSVILGRRNKAKNRARNKVAAKSRKRNRS